MTLIKIDYTKCWHSIIVTQNQQDARATVKLSSRINYMTKVNQTQFYKLPQAKKKKIQKFNCTLFFTLDAC